MGRGQGTDPLPVGLGVVGGGRWAHCLLGWGAAPSPTACGLWEGKWVSLRETGRPTNSQACLRLRVGRPLSVQPQFQINSKNHLAGQIKYKHINQIQLSWSVVQTGLPTLGWSNCLRLSFGAKNFVFGAEICLLWAIKILFGGPKSFLFWGIKEWKKPEFSVNWGNAWQALVSEMGK